MSSFKLSTKVADKNIQRNLYDIQDKINELQNLIESLSSTPPSLPPSNHSHTRSDITNFWSSPFWANIPDKPSTYPPEAHTHTRSEITGFWNTPFWQNIPDKPSTYPPEFHTHPEMGDMLKAVYDTDNDGIVDNAKLIEGRKIYVMNRPPQSGEGNNGDIWIEYQE
jgi:hypothetical protein